MLEQQRARILFLDDEPDILAGLRQTLRKQRQRWELIFCSAPEQALGHMAVRPVDVLVTDMRMPGMDGAKLLEEVALHSPGTVRLVLSGESCENQTLRAVAVTHQWIAKPCSRSGLVATLERVLASLQPLDSPELRELVVGIRQLPASADTLARLRACLESQGPNLERAGDLLDEDPFLCARVLGLVGSGFFGDGSPGISPREAVATLGQGVMRELLRTPEALPLALTGGSLEQALSHRALGEARCLRELCRHLATELGQDADLCGTAGLLSRLGSLLIDQPGALALGLGPDLALPVTAALLHLWGLPEALAQAILQAPQPGALSRSQLGPAEVLYLARTLAGDHAPDLARLEAWGLTEAWRSWQLRPLTPTKVA